MTDHTWKQAEREIAKRFNTERTGPMGERCPDAISEAYAIEVKHRSRLPKWLREAVEQVQDSGRRWAPHKLPIIVLHQKGQNYDECVVIVPTVERFVEWFGT